MNIKDNQKGIAHLAVILVIIIIVVTGFVGWKVWDASNNKQTPTNTISNASALTTDTAQDNFFTIKEWGVRFPSVKSGNFSYSLPTKGQGSTPELTNGGPKDMQFVYVNVSGFSKTDNKCVDDDGTVLGFATIYRHKEQNPTIQYTTTFQLNPKNQVKIGDWYYSTNGLTESGNCFEGMPTSPADYTKLISIFNENFKELSKY